MSHDYAKKFQNFNQASNALCLYSLLEVFLTEPKEWISQQVIITKMMENKTFPASYGDVSPAIAYFLEKELIIEQGGRFKLKDDSETNINSLRGYIDSVRKKMTGVGN